MSSGNEANFKGAIFSFVERKCLAFCRKLPQSYAVRPSSSNNLLRWVNASDVGPG